MRRHDNFSASYFFHPVQNGKIFQHKLIDFVHTNAMNPFSKLTNGEKAMKIVTNFLYFLRKIVRRHDNFSASYSFHPAQNGKIFQHRLIHFIHSNAMNPFLKLTNEEKVMKNRYKLLILCEKLCVAMPTFHRHIHSIPLRTEDFSTQTD